MTDLIRTQEGTKDGRDRGSRRRRAAARRRPGRRARTRERRLRQGAGPVGLRPQEVLPAPARGRQPDRPDRDRADRRSSPTASRPTGTTSSTCSTSRSRRRPRGPPLVRHRPARPRLLQPRHLRHPHVALGRAPRRGAATVIGTAIGAIAGYFGGCGRQPADAHHRPRPDAADARGAAGRRRSTSARATPCGSASSSRSCSGRARANRARHLPLPAREGVRRGGEGGRRRDSRIIVRHMLPNALGPIIVNATLIDRDRDPRRGGAVVPRLRDPAADAGARQADRRRAERGLRVAGGS